MAILALKGRRPQFAPKAGAPGWAQPCPQFGTFVADHRRDARHLTLPMTTTEAPVAAERPRRVWLPLVLRELSPRIWMKLAGIALSFIVPLLLTASFLVNEGNLKINFTQQEIRGDRYLRPLSRLLVNVGLHRTAVRRQDLAEATRTEAIIDADFRELLVVDRDLHGALKTTSAELGERGRASAHPSRLVASWDETKSAGAGPSEQLHDALLQNIRTLITAVGDSSNLILDPDLDSYYVMDALLLQEPALVDGLSRLGDMIDQLPGGDVALSANEQARLAGDVALLRFHNDALKADLESAFAETKNFNHNNQLKPTLLPLLAVAVETSAAVADHASSSVDRTTYQAKIRAAIEANSLLWSGLFNEQDRMLRSRESGFLSRRRLEIVAVGLSLILSLLLTFWVARRISRNVGAVAGAASRLAARDLDSRATVRSRDEIGVMANAFNTMADQMAAASLVVTSSTGRLNTAAGELAATTVQQSAAVAQASATTDELARASASIADAVDGVAAQAAETRTNLELAGVDMQLSSERTTLLADRVGEIGAILALINEIAEQTDLLALNAAIEAAHAGDEGRGFAVIAEEVRRLADRSKASAAEIASIVKGIQVETGATVMAMDQGAKQVGASLTLLSGVTDGAEFVRLTTQQQRSATSQVAETMEQLSDVSRQVSEAAGQIASASSALANISADLDGKAPVDRTPRAA
jgi:methyl-accepting chemotaxis protein